MAEMANSTTQAIQDQQDSLNPLVKVVMDNWVILDYLLAEQGRVCNSQHLLLCVHQQFREGEDRAGENPHLSGTAIIYKPAVPLRLLL